MGKGTCQRTKNKVRYSSNIDSDMVNERKRYYPDRVESKDNSEEWSLASFNPLAWLFPTKPKVKTPRAKVIQQNSHHPISRRAGLSRTKEEIPYNSFDFDLEKNYDRIRRRKRPSTPSKVLGHPEKLESQARLRQRRRRRRPQYRHQYDERISPSYMAKSFNRNHEDRQEDNLNDRLRLFVPNVGSKEETTQDLVMSDYDRRYD